MGVYICGCQYQYSICHGSCSLSRLGLSQRNPEDVAAGMGLVWISDVGALYTSDPSLSPLPDSPS